MVGLAPLSEEPIIEEESTSKRSHSFRRWLTSHWPLFQKKNDLKILLSVLGCPLSPAAVLPENSRRVASSADYIIQQFRATTGCGKIKGSVRSTFTTGRVKVVMSREQGLSSSPASASAGVGHKGCFVLWQMSPGMWLMELAVSGQKISAGSNGRVAWRRTPWLGVHAAMGGVRPLRRALQGLDPVTIAAVFTPAEHVGEKQIGDEECFALKLDTDHSTLATRSDGTAEIIKHVMLGYFSQRSGLLVYLEDSQLTRIQSPGAQAMYWETTISSYIEDYREVDGVMIAHSGRSTVNLQRFGAGINGNPVSTRMEETWTIDDVAFNVAGLSADFFIPPEDVKLSLSQLLSLNHH